MPTQGYRTAVDDDRVRLPRQVYTRVSQHDYDCIEAEAASRCITTSRFIRALLRGHIANQPPRLPRSSGPESELIREIGRIGNNLNQLARMAHVGNMAAITNDLDACIRNINAAVARIRPCSQT